jgi:hypothetical protein
MATSFRVGSIRMGSSVDDQLSSLLKRAGPERTISIIEDLCGRDHQFRVDLLNKILPQSIQSMPGAKLVGTAVTLCYVGGKVIASVTKPGDIEYLSHRELNQQRAAAERAQIRRLRQLVMTEENIRRREAVVKDCCDDGRAGCACGCPR